MADFFFEITSDEYNQNMWTYHKFDILSGNGLFGAEPLPETSNICQRHPQKHVLMNFQAKRNKFNR